jgi:hypothetical protein
MRALQQAPRLQLVEVATNSSDRNAERIFQLLRVGEDFGTQTVDQPRLSLRGRRELAAGQRHLHARTSHPCNK